MESGEAITMSMFSLIVFIITFGIGRIYLHLKYHHPKQIKDKVAKLKEVAHE